MSIGDNIRRIRIERGITQRELAEAANVTQSMMSQIERGSKVPSMPLGKIIADILKCGIEDLLATEDKPA